MGRTLPALLGILLILPSGAYARDLPIVASQDTAWFGGTTWAADSMRWEAILDSVWTFDTGVGSWINDGRLPFKPVGLHGGMEGWSGFEPESRGMFCRSEECAISGSWSLRAGADSAAAAALGFTTGAGYGNNWHEERVKTFQYPGSGVVTFEYQYAIEAEAEDILYVWIDESGVGNDYRELTTHSGTGSGSITVALIPGVSMRTTPGPFTLVFELFSEESGSDEDGLFPTTCGHTVIDDIRLSGAVNDTSDFETGDDGWIEWPTSFLDRSKLASIDDLPPIGSPPGPCSVADSVLVFHRQSPQGFSMPSNTTVAAASPWIDLSRHGMQERPGKFVSFDFNWRQGTSFFPAQLLIMARTRTDFGWRYLRPRAFPITV